MTEFHNDPSFLVNRICCLKRFIGTRSWIFRLVHPDGIEGIQFLLGLRGPELNDMRHVADA